MTTAQTHALPQVLRRYRGCAAAELGTPNVFAGWPGLVFLARIVEAAAPEVADALMHDAQRGRGAEFVEDTVPPQMADSFMFGARGRRWADAILAGADREDDSMPPARAVGFDTFVNDGPLFFGAATRGDRRCREAWADFIAEESVVLTRALAEHRRVPLGFAHGVAGLLFRMLMATPARTRTEDAALRGLLDWLAEQRVEEGDRARWPTAFGGEVPKSWVATSLCNGSLGHALLFAEASTVLDEPRYACTAQRALAATANEDAIGIGFCCGHAGRVAVISRCMRLGVWPLHPEADGSLSRLWARVGRQSSDEALQPISGLGSCIPALLARSPDSPILDFFLPAPVRA